MYDIVSQSCKQVCQPSSYNTVHKDEVLLWEDIEALRFIYDHCLLMSAHPFCIHHRDKEVCGTDPYYGCNIDGVLDGVLGQ